MKLMEEMALNDMSRSVVPKMTQGKVRGSVQKFVHEFNSMIHKGHQKALKEAYAVAVFELSQSK